MIELTVNGIKRQVDVIPEMPLRIMRDPPSYRRDMHESVPHQLNTNLSAGSADHVSLMGPSHRQRRHAE
jgi:hypothetical protein